MQSQIASYIGVFAGAFAAAAIICPLVIRVANYFGFTDAPDGLRKHHVNSIPLGGGLAVFLAVGLVSAVVWTSLANISLNGTTTDGASEVAIIPLAFASLLILLVGLVDDRYGMRGLHKLFGQSLAAGILIAGGCYFQAFEVSGIRFEVGHFGIVLSLFWILGAINAVNLIDGADGVAATLGIGICASLGIVAALTQGIGAAIVPLAMSGALLGFLLFNFPPAKLYLGDSGSMLIGLVAAAAAIQSSTKSQATFALAAPVALLAIPIMDTSFAIFRRKLTGRSIYDTDRGHFHHCLLNSGITPRQVVFVVAGLTLLTSCGAMASIWIGLDMLSLLAIGIVLAVLIRYRLYGRGEFALIWSRVWRRICGTRTSMNSSVQIQGSRNWEVLWNSIIEFAQRRELAAVQLTLSMPWLHEAFHGRWGDPAAKRFRSNWRWSVPLYVQGRHAGWLDVVGAQRDEVFESSHVYAEFVQDLEKDLAMVAGSDKVRPYDHAPVLRSRAAEKAMI